MLVLSFYIFGVEGGIPVRRFIVFLIRRRLGLKTYERFQFANQKSNAVYWFTKTGIMKLENPKNAWQLARPSSVSLYWILNDECEVVKI